MARNKQISLRNKPPVDLGGEMCYIVTQEGRMKKTLTIRLPDDLRHELAEISQTENKPMSDLVRESLKKYVSIYKFHQLRNKVLPFAEAQGILTDEDIFKLIS
jgi:predicted transcriptional regulator